MTASQAWAAFARLNDSGSRAIPARVSPQLGLLTLPTARNELAWGYHWHACSSIVPSPPPGATAPASPVYCTEWLFLDAKTGAQMDQTWQQ